MMKKSEVMCTYNEKAVMDSLIHGFTVTTFYFLLGYHFLLPAKEKLIFYYESMIPLVGNRNGGVVVVGRVMGGGGRGPRKREGKTKRKRNP